MRSQVRILVGVALIAAGAAGLIAMNLWTVPALGSGVHVRVPPVDVPTVRTVPEPIAPPVAMPSPAATVSTTAPDAAIADAMPDAVAVVSDASTSRSTDGTTFTAVVFEPQSKALSKDLIRSVGPIAAYMRHNFGMKAVLVGHGDAGMSAAEYVQLGRFRSAAVLRVLVDYGVSVARIGIEQPTTEGDRIVAPGVSPGTVEIRIEPRFANPKKGEPDVP